MIDFSLYCNICNAYYTNEKTLFSMVVENQYDGNAIVALLKKCDKNTIFNLIEYFDENAPIQSLLKNRLEEMNIDEEQSDIKEVVRSSKKCNKSFYQYLVNIISCKGFDSDSAFYNHISMSRQTFAKIRKTNYISRNHALLMAVGLELTYLEAVDFMENAGYAFRKTDSRETIITYVMRNRKYTLYSMEEILFAFGEKSLIENN
ncbi:MAG TPA: hypothetical protein H9914_04520 [Candidatus Blautia avicola]|uniref:Uncharacterized protein n=1 Tax=Candidatus Blautia avicola TaxID=2838483 RepID=A0A9D2QVL5_9FIRM|nr:hypothetical protein [Candidatus Blautia avicola]